MGVPRTTTTPKTIKIACEAGCTVPVPDTYGSIRFSFSQERICKDDPESIARAEELLYQACEKVVDKRLRNIRKLFNQIIQQDEPDTKPKGSAQERARKKMKK